jgi:hypothetical protein
MEAAVGRTGAGFRHISRGRYQEGVPGRLQVADDGHAAEALVQQQVAGPHPRPGRPRQQPVDDVGQRLASPHPGHGDGEAQAVAVFGGGRRVGEV